ncbi:PAB-dependent poly(A)-specific ribonuclease subunit pan3 [Acrodontium crateriforme]|uniref:PAN2-PAN3 deadenylation complex subunit PAN3 n=1 Tax=Acrodontium crateriforme TaxID=150365 RepID=A0AAQ3M9M3_9PEZI|nr:PAB-dependent poly(A)-specific ribonuclease subunit pan3 [Acrodontium crateriforme]
MPSSRRRSRKTFMNLSAFEARQLHVPLTARNGSAQPHRTNSNPGLSPFPSRHLSFKRSVTNPATSLLALVDNFDGAFTSPSSTHSKVDLSNPNRVSLPPYFEPRTRLYQDTGLPQFGSLPFSWPSHLFQNPNWPAKDQRRAWLTSDLSSSIESPSADPRRDSLDVLCDFLPSRNDMAAGFQRISGDARRYSPQSSNNSSRFETRPSMNHTLCRNGPQCRKYQEGTCNYNHDFGSMAPNGGGTFAKKSLNVDSPSFTPKSPNAVPAKVIGISPKAAAAATFTPRGSGAATPATKSHSKEPSAEFIPQAFQTTTQFNEFVPGQSFLPQQIDPQSALGTPLNQYSDPFLAQQALQQTIAGLDGTQAQINPYAQAAGVGAQAYFPDTSGFRHPLNYHLYASIGPRRDKMLPYQRASADFFIPDDLREDLQRKSEAALQIYANSTLPHVVEHFHSLVALDTSSQKASTAFGYPTSIYKAISSKDGHTYALRRIEGFRLTNEVAIRPIQAWKRINNANVVQVYDAFTGRWFGDSSLVIVTDYHPMAQTVVEKHFNNSRFSGNTTKPVPGPLIPENDLWGYIVQLASALSAIHEAGLAAQTITASKVLVTAKNRLRLNACGINDVVHYEQRRPIGELQRADLEDLGCLILDLASRNIAAHHNVEKSLQSLHRTYSERLRSCLSWLLSPPSVDPATEQSGQTSSAVNEYNITNFLQNIADKVVTAFDNTLQYEDTITGNLMRELENARLVRLLAKLNVILERPESSTLPTSSSSTNPSAAAALNQPSTAWSETGERFYLKLFRDYVFHQVDHNGRPVLDLGHIVTCLNKLDAGIDERIQLISRDEQNMFIVTYRDVKRAFDAAWTELSKASTATIGRR